MNFRLFFTSVILTTIYQSFSVTPLEQLNLNKQLRNAVKQAHNAAVTSLVQAGADINTKDCLGSTPLHCAATHGHTATVELLLSKGADINAKGQFGRTPLYPALYNSHTETVKLLLSHHADISAKDDVGLTSVDYAVIYGRTAIAEPLKAYQALLQQSQKPTKALLKEAIENGHYGLVKLLLQRGLKPNPSDLQRAKEKSETAQYKQSYKAIGRLLVRHLSLVPGKVPPIRGRISKAGIVGLYELPENIAEEIAQYNF